MKKKGILFLLTIITILSLTNCVAKQDIVGLWTFYEYEYLGPIEFTENGQFYSQGGIGEYEILENGSIHFIYQDEDDIWSNVNIKKDTATVEMDDTKVTLHRVKGYPDLEDDLIGTWKDKEGEFVTLEFLKGGKLILHDDEFWDEYGYYSIISDNTVLITTEDSANYFVVFELSKNNLEIAPWDETYTINYVREK